MDTTSTVIFIIAAFSLGAILIMKRDALPERMRRGMAIVAIVLIALAFFFIVYAFLTMGTAEAADSAFAPPTIDARTIGHA